MIGADYYEPEARALRSLQNAHWIKCDECGKDTCNPQTLNEDYKPCRFCGERGGSSIVEGRILCGMCY